MKTKHDKLAVIIPAAGAGKRMGGDVPKILIPIDGIPLLQHTLSQFMDLPVTEMIIPVSEAIRDQVDEICRSLDPGFPVKIVQGGAERQDSIRNALESLDPACNLIAVHDAARPFFDHQLIFNASELLETCDGVIAAVPAMYTMKQVYEGFVENTPDRASLWQVNTPQIFHRAILLEAYRKAADEGFYGTDDAMLVERAGGKVRVYQDISHNIKITTPADLYAAGRIMNRQEGALMQRIGQGYDVHRLVEDRKLILGGVDISFEKGLDGHSDADVLVHAIMDALLGALALGDIGKHFPDTDPKYKGSNSMRLLSEVWKLPAFSTYVIQNIDATIILQQPKVAPYIDRMRSNIADVLSLDLSRVSVKATTEEGLGFTGRGEGVAAKAVILLTGK